MMFSQTTVSTLCLLLFPLACVVSAGQNVLYTLANDPKGASIVAMGLSKDGTIMSSKSTSTGGKGGLSSVGKGQPAIGSLFSSNSVVVTPRYLFTVNAGSNTLSMFYINPKSPMAPKLVGKPVDTLGDFPVSVAFSHVLQQACVLNGGKRGGVSCFSVDPNTGLGKLDTEPRSIAKALNQTTPPVGPFSTASDIAFNPSSSALIASIKGNPETGKAGYLYAWPVKNKKVSREAVISQPEGTVLDFSISFIDSDFEFLLSDPALGAWIIGAASDLKMSTLAPVKVSYQKAICWSQYVGKIDTVFLIDAASANVTAIDSRDAQIANTIDTSTPAIDPTVVDTSLYAVTEAGTVLNIDFRDYKMGRSPKEVQAYKPKVTKGVALVGLDVFKGADEAEEMESCQRPSY